jgi:hypothetical protein
VLATDGQTVITVASATAGGTTPEIVWARVMARNASVFLQIRKWCVELSQTAGINARFRAKFRVQEICALEAVPLSTAPTSPLAQDDNLTQAFARTCMVQ